MLDQLIQMATQQLGQQFIENPDVPNDQFDVNQVAQTTGSSIFETIAGQIGGGNIGGITEMLSGQQTGGNNPLVSGIASNVVNSLVQKSGLSPQLAQTIASVAVPFVMNMFNKQAGAAQSGGMDIGGLISGALSGGGGNQGGGGLLGGLLGGILGGNKQQSGGGDLGSQVLGSVLGQLLKK
jgi:hypothetical protein